MKVLFVTRHGTYVRNFESVVRALSAEGHRLHLAVEQDEALGGQALVDRLVADCPGVTAGAAAGRERDAWEPQVRRVRLASDYLRYLEPAYAGTPRLRERAAYRAPAFAVRFGESGWARFGPARGLLRWLLRAAEDALPSSAAIEAYLRAEAPDVLLVTPLIGLGSAQVDYLRAARALGIPSALLVWSWDHLSSKALIRDVPDRVIVWNDIQRDEAVRLHRVPRGRVEVTGAQCFDLWFDRAPSRSREAFMRERGLDPSRPLVLYVCSAPFGGSDPEAAFVEEWLAALRATGDARLRDANVLVRPHPQRTAEWEGVDLSGLGPVAVHGGNPVTDAARDDYFDALAHSTAVVGLNTSAFLEAAIAGRPVLAPLVPRFRDSQQGTIHFHYLTTAGGGLLRLGATLDEHLRQLGGVLAAPPGHHVNDRFVEAFLRPHGLREAATPRVASAIRTLAGQPVPARRPARPLAGRLVLGALRRIERSRRWRHWLFDAEGRRTQAWAEEKARQRAAARRAGLRGADREAAEREMREQRRLSGTGARGGRP